MSFDFMKNFMHWEDEERFNKICEGMEEVIRSAETEAGKNKIPDLELMQALDYIGFSLFRDNWEEFKKMGINSEVDLLSKESPKDNELIN